MGKILVLLLFGALWGFGSVEALADRWAASGGKIIDSHIHLWNFPRTDGAAYPSAKIPWLNREYLMEDYREALLGKKVGGVVLVESSVGLSGEDLFVSNEWMLRQAEALPSIVAVVGKLDLMAGDFLERLDALRDRPAFAGLRIDRRILDKNGELRPQGRRALAATISAGLVVESNTFSLVEVAWLADAFPQEAKFVINHLAGKRRSFEVEAEWVAGLRLIAPHPNVFVKVSDIQRLSEDALGVSYGPVPYAGVDDPEPYRPMFEALYETLGPRRLVFGSNWPVSNVTGDGGD